MFSENLRYLRSKFGMEQMELAEKLGRKSSSSISEWEKGKYTPRAKTLAKIANLFSVDLDDLMNIDLSKAIVKLDISAIYNKLEPPRQAKVYNFAEQQLDKQNKVVSIEETHFDDGYVGQTAAGAPIEGQQPVPMLGSDTVKLLVNGDSMEPMFKDRDIVEYHPQPELENGEIGVFAVNGGVTMKKFKINSDIRLESLNKKYQDIVIKETDDFNILGKVII